MKTFTHTLNKPARYFLLLVITVILLFRAATADAQLYTQSTTIYSWDAPSTSVSTTSCDDCALTLTIPFTFKFFGTNYTTCYVSTNGLMTFGSSSTVYSNLCIPNTTSPNNFIAAYWDDLYFDYGCSPTFWRYGTFGTTPNRRFVVSWVAFRAQSGSCSPYVYTEIKLFETTNVVEVHLQSNGLGSLGTIGIENSAGTAGYQAICNSATTNGTAWKWTPASPAYASQWISMNAGSSAWCAGETRNVSVTVKNNGTAAWTDASPDVNIGCKWNADPDYLVRVNAGGLAAGAQQTYTFTMTAPSTAGSNNLTFDVVKEGDCWFGNNNGSCGPGNTVYASSALTINPNSATAGTISVAATAPNGSSVTYTYSGGTGTFSLFQYQWDGTSGSWTTWGATNPYTWTASNPGHTLYVRALLTNGCYTVYSAPVSTAVEFAVPASGSTTFTTCAGHLYDAAGSAGYYANSQDGYVVIYPTVAGSLVQLSGSYNTEPTYDYLYIYNGVGTGGSLLFGGASGSGSVPLLTSSDASGALTVRFTSDGSVTYPGFDLTIGCCTMPTLGTLTTSAANACNGNTVTYNYSGGTGTFSRFEYQWNGTGGTWSTLGTTNPYAWTANSPGNTLYVRAVISSGSCNGYTSAAATVVDGTAPTHDAVTTNSTCWINDNAHTYTITIKSTEPGMGIGGSFGMMALINFQGENAGQYGGYFAWHPTTYIHSADQMLATGGGYASKSPSYGGNTITLFSCATSVSGNQRTVVFTVRPNSGFPSLADNDISMYTTDVCGNIATWDNWQTNFSSGNFTTAPTLSSPANSTVVTTSPYTVTWSGNIGTHANSRYEVQLNGGAWTSAGTATSYGASLNAGSNTWTVRYYDGCSGNYFTSPTWTLYYVPANYCGTVDHYGQDWTISTNTTVAGNHINIGTFTLNNGITATVDATCHYFNVDATTINVYGNIDANGAGYAGGAGGSGGMYADGDDTYCQGGGGGTGGAAGAGPGGGAVSGNGTQGNCSLENCNLLCSGNNGYHDGGGGAGGGGGGSYGGYGGYGAYGAYGSQFLGGGGVFGSGGSYGTTTGNSTDLNITYGSGGGGAGGGGGGYLDGGNGSSGGNGGGAVSLISATNLTISGSVLANGTTGGAGGSGGGRSTDNTYNCSSTGYNACGLFCTYYVYDAAGGAGGGGGAGSGGGIKLQANGVTNITGTLSAAGGGGGTAGSPNPSYGTCFDYSRGGAGGGGGRIKVVTNPCLSNNIAPSVNINGGSGGSGYATGANGGIGSYSNNLIVPGFNNLAVNVTGGTSTICNNTNPGTLTASATGGTGSYTYLWYKDGASTGVTTPTYNPGNLTANAIFYCAVSSGTCGPINTTNVNISIESVPPVITCPSSSTLNCAPGTCGAMVNYSAPVGTDNCPNPVTTQTTGLGSGSVFPIGTTTNTFRVTDTKGSSNSCSFTVTVIDNQPPVLSCPANITVSNDPWVCGAVVTYNIPYTDNCSGAVLMQNSGLSSGSLFPIGITTNSFVVTDVNGNSNVCSFTVKVNDTQYPVIDCPADQYVQNDPGICGAIVNYNIFYADNCAVTLFAQTGGLPSGSTFPVGATTNYFRAIDPSFNLTFCTFTVTVLDQESPSVNCLSNPSVSTDNAICSYTVSGTEFDPVSVTDNCPGTMILNDFNNSTTLAGEVFPVGNTTVVWITTDAAFNVNTCSMTITVTDAELPAALCQDLAVHLDPAGTASITAAQANNGSYDNCGVASMTLNQYNFDCSDVGYNMVAFTVTDVNGNTSICSFQVEVIDDNPPAISYCPADQFFSTDPGVCTYQVQGTNLFDIVYSDNCPNTWMQNSYNGLNTLDQAVFQKGTETVFWSVGDASGNTGSCSFTVTVVDTESPLISCIGDQIVETDPGICSYTVPGNLFDPLNSWDNCQGASVLNDYNVLPSLDGAVFPKGTTVVNWEIMDASYNISSCSFTVTVEDNEAPVIICPQDQERYTETTDCYYFAVGAEFDPYINDNCDNFFAQNDYNVLSTLENANFPKGAHPITWTVYDANGNTTLCNFTVTILDAVLPTIICPGNQVRNTNELFCSYAADGNEFDPQYSDNCSGSTISNDYNAMGSLASAVFQEGTTIVTWTVIDASNNTNYCGFTVTVNDEEAPQIVCPQDITLCYDNSSFPVITMPFYVWDNCGVLSVITDQPPVFPAGINAVTWTVEDIHGNTNTCLQTVYQSDWMSVNISQSNLPVFCQGEEIKLTADVTGTPAVDYYWSGGETTQSIHAGSSGLYTVNVTNALGCQATANYQLTLDVTDLLSSYIILTRTHIQLKKSMVYGGGLGVINDENGHGKLEVREQSVVTAAGTFARSSDLTVENQSLVAQPYYTAPDLPLPAFEAMTGHGSITENIPEGTTMYLNGSLYKEIKVGKNATAIFTAPVIDIDKHLKMDEGATIRFAQCAKVHLNENLDAGKNVTINPDGTSVVFYVGHDGKFKEGANVTGVFIFGDITHHGEDTTYHHLHISNSKSTRPASFTGMFIAECAHSGKYTTWHINPNCHYCDPDITKALAAFEEPANTEIVSDPFIENSPNPFSKTTMLKFILPEDGKVSVDIYDLTGKLVQNIFTGNVTNNTEYRAAFDGSGLPTGIYIYRLTTDNDVYTGKMMLVK